MPQNPEDPCDMFLKILNKGSISSRNDDMNIWYWIWDQYLSKKELVETGAQYSIIMRFPRQGPLVQTRIVLGSFFADVASREITKTQE